MLKLRYLVFCLLAQLVVVYGSPSTPITPVTKTNEDSSKDSVLKNVVKPREEKSSPTSHTAEILKCISKQDYSCVLDHAQDMLIERHQRFLVEADETALASTGRKQDENSTPSILMDTISSLVSEISDILFKGGLGGFFRDSKEDKIDKNKKESAVEEEDEDEDEEEEEEEEATEVATSRGIRNKALDSLESRGKKKKKKKQKIKALIKFLVIGAVLYFKLTLLLKVLAAHLQIKFLLIALAGLLINGARFYMDVKKGHNPQKVIYYEHAQHQHHYENDEEGWGGGGGGGGGGYWARNYDKEEKDEEAAQNLAYRAQRPETSYTRGEDTPGSSWFF